MVNRTALKVGALAALAVVGFFLLRWLLSWLVRLVQVVGVALVAAGVAYVAYRLWAALSGDGEAESASEPVDGPVAAGTGPLDDLGTDDLGTDDLDAGGSDGPGADRDDAGGLTDEEFRKELEELDDS